MSAVPRGAAEPPSSSPRAARWALGSVWLLVVVSVVSWRQGAIFGGGVDPFVIGKAAIAVLGFAGAAVLRAKRRYRRRVGPIAPALVALIVAVSLLGAEAAGELSTAFILAVRIALLIGTITLLVSAHTDVELVQILLFVMGLVAVVAAVTGLPGLVAGQRLDGGAPALAANELATVALPPAIGAVYAMARRGITALFGLAFAVLSGIVVLTGSRTALIVLAAGLVLVFLTVRPLARGPVVLGLLAVPLLYFALAFTDIPGQLASRGEDPAKLLTLNSRTIAWDAVLATPQDSWAWWLGQGLQLKTVAVTGQYWNRQVLDSSWISAIAQTGIIGTALLAALVITTAIFVIRRQRLRGIAAPLLMVIVVRSFLENGLLESSVTFTLLITIALCTDPHTGGPAQSRNPLRPPAPRLLAVPLRWIDASHSAWTRGTLQHDSWDDRSPGVSPTGSVPRGASS